MIYIFFYLFKQFCKIAIIHILYKNKVKPVLYYGREVQNIEIVLKFSIKLALIFCVFLSLI